MRFNVGYKYKDEQRKGLTKVEDEPGERPNSIFVGSLFVMPKFNHKNIIRHLIILDHDAACLRCFCSLFFFWKYRTDRQETNTSNENVPEYNLIDGRHHGISV